MAARRHRAWRQSRVGCSRTHALQIGKEMRGRTRASHGHGGKAPALLVHASDLRTDMSVLNVRSCDVCCLKFGKEACVSQRRMYKVSR